MKTNKVRIVIESQDKMFKRAADAWGKIGRGEQVNPSRVLGFSDISTFRKVLTEERLRILKAVRQHKPDSIYRLAKLLNRDLKSVNTDVYKLKQLGLIQLSKTTYNGRKRTAPKVTFDNLQLNIALA